MTRQATSATPMDRRLSERPSEGPWHNISRIRSLKSMAKGSEAFQMPGPGSSTKDPEAGSTRQCR